MPLGVSSSPFSYCDSTTSTAACQLPSFTAYGCCKAEEGASADATGARTWACLLLCSAKCCPVKRQLCSRAHRQQFSSVRSCGTVAESVCQGGHGQHNVSGRTSGGALLGSLQEFAGFYVGVGVACVEGMGRICHFRGAFTPIPCQAPQILFSEAQSAMSRSASHPRLPCSPGYVPP